MIDTTSCLTAVIPIPGLSSQPLEGSKPVKSFVQYKKARGTEWKGKVSTSAEKKVKQKDEK